MGLITEISNNTNLVSQNSPEGFIFYFFFFFDMGNFILGSGRVHLDSIATRKGGINMMFKAKFLRD